MELPYIPEISPGGARRAVKVPGGERSQTPKVAPTVDKMMVYMMSAETVNIMNKTVAVKASAGVVWGVKNSEAVVWVACTVLEGQDNHCITRSVHSEELAGQG